MSTQLNDVWLAKYYQPGHYESDRLFSHALQIANHDILFRHALKEASTQQNPYATFLGKPFLDRIGLGCHTHHLHRQASDTNTNLFARGTTEHKYLNFFVSSFVADPLAHAPARVESLGLTINAYPKCLIPDSFCNEYEIAMSAAYLFVFLGFIAAQLCSYKFGRD